MDIFSAVRMVLERECPELELRTEEPMARHTTFRVGGPARLMAFPRDKKEIKAAVRAADEMGVIPFFLGNGSNLLVADEGVEAFVIKTGGLDQTREVNRRLRAECGIPLSRLAVAALGRGLTGLEFAHGIPGSLGGAVVMNAGAYGGEMVQVLTAVTYLDKHGQEHTVPASECGLTYRHSMFTDHPEWLVLEAEMELEQGDAEEIRAKMEDLAQRRKSKQPLEYPSAGSTFKRPEGHFAAALIEQCGLKGLTVGGAQVSEKHAGFVINRGGATCADILKLTEQIKETVLRETGVTLELEVRTLGCG
ncbi:UDP-N-acetylmuramate dehydrogenase [Pseudoflavonifractor capillosus ATCC 29799]|uniref:UDP-N-acetylenolpyruvoylglucosamine reductase n=1 Tax=Pseudoflavonifractor capillosus ATCC 29799 TaxID=411467 RepID=A6NZ76_9FIRM|nr:UDP-N-acetylmuramate dehydrogenase [Pseudoflavonifractor capillosus]EDM98725.1 UDP-N-acetylmuramate dehydrogenase [Pseudoflavonifractor capillosus ATCC 29799]